jgi:hypothetical protein
MAYNILKDDVEFSGVNLGNIEDMVDDHSNQTIGGTKTFSQMVTASSGLSASAFYGDGSALSGLPAPAIETYNSSGANRLLTSVDSTTVQGEANLLFDGSSLTVTGDVTASVNVSASAFHGDGNPLRNIGPASLNLGAGLQDLAGNLELNLDTDPGLQIAAGGLKVHASTLTAAGALGDTDLFITDQSGNKKATALQIYNYVDGKLTIPSVAGSDSQIQFNDAGDLGASANLTFNTSTNIFSTVTASFTGDVNIQGDTAMSGTLNVNVDRTGTPLITLDKGEGDTAEIEFKNNGITVAELYTNAGENVFLRSVALSVILRQGTNNVLTINSSDTTFAHRPVTVNNNLTITGSTTTASRILNVSSSGGNCSIDLTNEVIIMANLSAATASLPTVAAAEIGLTYTIKRVSDGAVEVSGSVGQMIDGINETRLLSSKGEFIKLIATEVGPAVYGWAIIGKSGSF